MTWVLLAGDVSNREALSESLSDAGLSVLHARDAVDAVERLEATAIDCVLLGGTDDPDRFVRNIQRRGYDVPVLLLGGYHTQSLEAEAVVENGDATRVIQQVQDVLADERIDRERTRRRQQRAAVDAAKDAVTAVDSGDEALEELCHRLAASRVYTAAWLGRHETATASVVPWTSAGIPTRHLAEIPVDADADSATARAVKDGTVAVDDDSADACLAVPIGDGPIGVLHLYADRPDGVSQAERDTLRDLGDALAEQVTERGATGDGSDVSVLGDTLAHELGNQLDIATMHLELARERDDQSHFNYVESALDQMSTLAENAQTLAEGELDVQTLRLEPLAEDAWETVDAPGAELEVTDTPVEGDPALLALLLQNLLRNAVEHGATTPQPPTREPPSGDDADGDDGASEPAVRGADLTVRAGPLDDGVFYVEDDGKGIPEAEREQVFEWGYSSSGSGIGLGIASLAAKRHGWDVELTESEEGGARFEFR